MIIKDFKLFENKKPESKSVIVDVKHSDDNIIQNLVNNLTYVIHKRVLRNLRIIKIDGDLSKLDISELKYSFLNITMSNNDKILAEFTINTNNMPNIKLTINDNVIYDLDYHIFTLEIMIQKIVEYYTKYLTENNWKIKNEN